MIKKSHPYIPYILLFVQPIFMATNIIVARGGVEYVPPVSLAFWRWVTVFLILLPFFYVEILQNKKNLKKEFWKLFFLDLWDAVFVVHFPLLLECLQRWLIWELFIPLHPFS